MLNANRNSLRSAALLMCVALTASCSLSAGRPNDSRAEMVEPVFAELAQDQGGPTPPSSLPTEADYLAAVEETQQCVAADGFVVTEVFKTATGDYQFNISADSSGAEVADAIEASYSKCYDEHLDSVVTQYNASQRLTGVERDLAMEQLVDCLDRAGVSGLSVDETDSQVFVSAIMAKGSESTQAYEGLLCFDTYRGVWPTGDPNSL